MTDILIVDDEEGIRSLVADILKDEGYTPQLASSAAQAIDIIDNSPPPKVAILDIWLEGSEMDGLGVLKHLKARHPNVPAIMISGHGNIETAVRSIRLGAYDFIEKPFKGEKLLIIVQRAIEAASLAQMNHSLQEQHKLAIDLHGSSRAIQIVKTAAITAAPANSRIFITGEPGTGKEVLARYIHLNSKRAGKPFIVLNVANLPPEQIEGEMFGMQSSDKGLIAGALEMADGGTLFIDEIADMPLSTQTKLLKFLQQNSYERIGQKGEIKSDVRIIASSSVDIKTALDAGTLQKSLYYRLSVVPIRIPPLRERAEDLQELAEHFAKQLAGSQSKHVKITQEAYAILQMYEWPGNVRQLRNTVEWLTMMAASRAQAQITPELLPQDIVDSVQNKHTFLKPFNSDLISKELKPARDSFEREYLLAQLKRFGGNISKTAQFIGMDRTALHRKLRHLGIAVAANDAECA
ncbi:MAG: sigma-54-dependent Fis family transcriptional regulator [Proteobacteria bacterium]|nr:sigma-54-dependent Fis family transcriptional regulator [Pseudomonadota bacterium]